MASDVQQTALAALAAGLSTVPIRPGGKVPACSWEPYQRHAMQPADVDRMFRNGCGIGLVCGPVSGNLELLDFDDPELFRPFGDTLESVNPDLRGRLTTWQETPSGGFHLLYRCSAPVGGNTVLARDQGGKAAIETRGEGGQFLIAPSKAKSKQDGELHPYTMHGTLDAIPTISPEDRELLHSIAKSFDEGGHQEQEQRQQCVPRQNGNTGDRPGDRFNAETDWSALLTGYGWRYLKTVGDRQHWQRPGKTGPEASATLRHDIEAGFWAFTTSTPLPEEKPLTKFAVFTYTEHHGDFAAAAGALAARYGMKWDGGGKQEQTEQGKTEPEEWQDPIPLDQPDLPTFDAGDFPPVLWSMIEGIAKATETPVELAGMNVLAVAAAACQRKLTIELKDYCEPLPLWTATQLPPGSRKSAAQKPAIRPLLRWEVEQAQALAPVIKAARATREADEGRLKELQKKFSKEEDAIKREALREEIETAEASLTEVPRSPRIIGQDITPEQLPTLMAQNGERLALFSSEGGVFSIMAGRYSGGVPNLDVYLQCHSGDTIRVDRGSRPSVYLQEPALTMGLSVQPDVLTDMASKPIFRGRGLVGRFLFCTPRDIVGKRTLETVPIPETVAAGYDQTITALLNMGEQRNMLTGELFAIQLTEEAHAAWREFALWVESAVGEGGELEHMRDWGGKLPGAAGRIAGVFHCVECAKHLIQAKTGIPEEPNASTVLPWELQMTTATPDRYPLTEATMRTALNLARKLVPHAIHTFALMGEGGDIQAARRVLRWIEGTGVDEFTARDCHAALKGTFQKRADLNPGLAVLMERGFIRRVQPPARGGPGRKREPYQVNPAVKAGKG